MKRLFHGLALLGSGSLFALPAAARDECIAIMQVVGVPANVAAASDESNGDKDGDGDIWLNQGGGRMMGFIACSEIPGARDGDSYTQQYSSGKTRRTGNDPHTRLLYDDYASRSGSGGNSSAASSGTGGRNGSTSGRGSTNTAPQVPGKKRAPVAVTQ